MLSIAAWQSTRGPANSPAYEGTPLGDLAQDFRLVDQHGRRVALADFRGKVVVLTLLDPDCADICPVYAHQFRLAQEALGTDAGKVAFLAFNSNDEKTSIADVAAATKKWGVDRMSSWHFLTGSPDALRAVWRAYGVLGSGPPKPGRAHERQHSPSIFIIDQAGRRRWYLSAHFEGAPPASELIVRHVKALLGKL